MFYFSAGNDHQYFYCQLLSLWWNNLRCTSSVFDPVFISPDFGTALVWWFDLCQYSCKYFPPLFQKSTATHILSPKENQVQLDSILGIFCRKLSGLEIRAKTVVSFRCLAWHRAEKCCSTDSVVSFWCIVLDSRWLLPASVPDNYVFHT